MSSTSSLRTTTELHGALREAIAPLDSVIVAYSGGVDSSLVAYVAAEVLGERALAVTSDSATESPWSVHHRGGSTAAASFAITAVSPGPTRGSWGCTFGRLMKAVKTLSQ